MSNDSLTQKTQGSTDSKAGFPGFVVGSILVHVLALVGIAYYSYKDEAKQAISNLGEAGEKLDVVMVEDKANPTSGVGQEIPVPTETSTSGAIKPMTTSTQETSKPADSGPSIPASEAQPAKAVDVKALPPKKEPQPTQPKSLPPKVKSVIVAKSTPIKSEAVPTQIPEKESVPTLATNEPTSEPTSPSEVATVATSENFEEPQSPNQQAERDEVEKESTNAPVLRLKPAKNESTGGSEATGQESQKVAAHAPVNFDELDREVENEEGASGAGAGSGAGAESSSLAPSSSTSEGSGPIRNLSQITQMPNNPRPQYSNEERLKGQQGLVTFHAYISQEGVPENFNLIKSTGHRNLDKKSLQTLKSWRFQPGQEGWVELSFSWNLKGDPQPVSRPLRTGGKQHLD